jgi:putative membrane protein
MLLAAGDGGEVLVRCASVAGRPASQVEDTPMPFLIRLLVNAAALWVATRIVTGVTYSGALAPLIGVALVFGVVNAIIRPILKLLTFPLFIVTFGLFAFVLNGLMLWLTSSLSSALGLRFHVAGFVPAFLGALVVSVVSTLLGVLVPEQED